MGLGFGGNNYRDFRLFLSENLEEESYICNEDNTYELGFLAGTDTKSLNLKVLI
jgi:hypothetical protein